MKNYLFLLLSICFAEQIFAQKPVIDSTAIATWPNIGSECSISNDGNYFLFTVYNHQENVLLIQSTNSEWKREFYGVTAGSFTGDNKKAIFKRNDTLFFLPLGDGQIEYIMDVDNYKQPEAAMGEWLGYQLKKDKNKLTLLNLKTGKEQHFTDAVNYQFDNKGNMLLLINSSHREGDSENSLQIVDLKKQKIKTIWSEKSATNNSKLADLIFDGQGAQLTFIIENKKKDDDFQFSNTIWYYKVGMDEATMLLNNQSSGITPGLSISKTAPFFSLDGQYILFRQAQPHKNIKPDSNAVMVDIWSYQDSVLQSIQLFTGDRSQKEFLSAINITTKQVIQIERDDEKIAMRYNEIKGDFVVIATKQSIIEYWWKTFYQKNTFLVSLKNGTRKLLNSDSLNIEYSFSPSGKYLIYYDRYKKSYFNYNLLSGETLNISAGISTNLSTEYYSDSLRHRRNDNVGIAGWLKNDNALFVYDNYDIWKLDPLNKKPPVNITNSYGKLHQIKLRLINENPATIYSENDTLLLTAFNPVNKYNGFFSTILNTKRDPVLLSMGPFHIYIQPSQIPGFMNMPPLKAREADKWIIKRESATEVPNFFFTTDFRNYRKLTDIQPQKNYNWLTAELITWKQIDGTPCQGILYKPENFDPLKKYPVIFHYYETLSDYIYEFPNPDFSTGPINVPWFTSRGYLVFRPDIHYYVGKTGESICNSIVSAAHYLSQMSWVDSLRMGISGHSFGGYETNYLVTHTNMFAAAVTAAAVSDMFRQYSDLLELNNGSSQYKLEGGQYRIGFSLWERPDLYIANSPIFKADQVTTPLLIMHNKRDQSVAWLHSVEFFTGLRRLGKKVWMLQYDKGTHGVNGKEAIDYTIRINQFFDHYLKDTPPPKWMTNGIPAKLKGLQTGYELDNTGKTP